TGAIFLGDQVETEDVAGNLNELPRHHTGQPEDLGNAVANAHDAPHVRGHHLSIEVLQTPLDYLTDLVRADCQLCSPFQFLWVRGFGRISTPRPAAAAAAGAESRRWRR